MTRVKASWHLPIGGAIAILVVAVLGVRIAGSDGDAAAPERTPRAAAAITTIAVVQPRPAGVCGSIRRSK